MYIEEPAKLYDTTNPDWIPSVNMGYTSYHGPDQERYKRAEQRAKKRRITPETSDSETMASTFCETATETKDRECQTDDIFMNEYKNLKSTNDSLRKENTELKLKVKYLEQKVLSIEHLKQSDHLLKFYTGS